MMMSNEIKCIGCGSSVYLERGLVEIDVGLDEPVVVCNVDCGKCTMCSEEYEFVPQYHKLLQLIALRISKKDGQLTDKEVRFLQDVLGKEDGDDNDKDKGIGGTDSHGSDEDQCH
jgi:hypothetical protein